jgi:hypothetical protein
VLFKDKITFESELENQQIQYYCDIQNQPNFENGIRYFINDYDKIKIDEIFIKNGIVASTETINVFDYRDNKKIMSIYLIISAIVVLIMILMSLL